MREQSDSASFCSPYIKKNDLPDHCVVETVGLCYQLMNNFN